MKDTCPYCEAGMIETDEAFSLDGPNGPITITGSITTSARNAAR